MSKRKVVRQHCSLTILEEMDTTCTEEAIVMFAETFKRVFVVEEILADGFIPARVMSAALSKIDVGTRTDEAEAGVGAGVGSATIATIVTIVTIGIIEIPVGVPAPRINIGVKMTVSDKLI